MAASSVRRSSGRQGPTLIFTCEHGGNVVPRRYQAAMAGSEAALETHRGLDIGALAVAKQLAKTFKAPLHYATVTRLLCDLNRSTWHKRLFSEWTRDLPAAEQEAILAKYYQPYRESVERDIAARLRHDRRVIHLSIHSFTPKLNGEIRNCEIGLLYDPRRAFEATCADLLHAGIASQAVDLRVRRNYPYTGVSDGFQTYLRRTFAASRYAALEIEMNQGVVESAAGRRQMLGVLRAAIAASLV